MVGKIGCSLGPLLSMSEVIGCAKIADEHNSIDSIWVPESWDRESFATLGALSQVTKRVKLGTSIISIYSRTPATVAMAATTVDMLSNNRAIIGLGVSTPAIVENWHGVKFESPVSRMQEYIHILKTMITGDKVNYEGKFFKVSNFKIMHQPERTHIPIYVAAINNKMISLASEIADGILFYLRPINALTETVATLRQTKRERDFEIACSFICAISDKEPHRARQRAAKTLAFYISVGKYYGNFISENGFKEEVKQIRSSYAKFGVDDASTLIPEKMLNAITICGNKEECRKSLERFMSSGITLPILQFNPIDNPESSFRELMSIL